MVISQCMKWGTCSYQYWKDLTWNSYGVYPQRFGEYKKHQTMCHCVPLLSDCCIPYPQYFIYEASKGKWKSINILHIYIVYIYMIQLSTVTGFQLVLFEQAEGTKRSMTLSHCCYLGILGILGYGYAPGQFAVQMLLLGIKPSSLAGALWVKF